MTRHARCAGLRLTPLLWLVALSCAQPTNAGPRRFEADDKQVHALAFSPDAKLMATAGADPLAKL